MKNSFLTIAFITFSIFTYGNNVKGKVAFNFTPVNDSITIVVVYHDGSFSPDILDLDTMMKISPGDFELQLHPGTYICRILHPEINITDIPLVIEGIESKIEFDINLEKSNLPPEIRTVQLVIRTNDKNTKVFSLIKSGDNWNVPQKNILPKNIKSYVFRVNNSQYYHRSHLTTQLQRVLLYYENTYQGEEIYFSEDEFSKRQNRISFKSNDIDLVYFYLIFNKINEVYESSYIAQLDNDSARNATYFHETSLIFDNILEQENPFYFQLVIEPYLKLIDRHHPVNLKLRSVGRNVEAINSLKQTESFKNMEVKKLDLLKSLDVNSLFLSGSFLNSFRILLYEFKTPEKYIEYDIPFGFFQKLEYDFKQHTPSYFAKGSMLYRDIQQLKRVNPNKALQLISTIEEEYPDHPSSNPMRLEKLKAELLLKKGTKAPEFELVNFTGDTIRLSDYKGKFIFLDFWGTWCAPCMSELPHIKELYENIPDDKLVIIGVACNDKKDKVKRIIHEKDLQYLIAMANDYIIDDYGVSSYPTTFLIDQKGIIIGKNLRGSNLTGSIKNILSL